MNIIRKIKIKLFEKHCPKIKCCNCENLYYDKDKNRKCKLVEKYKL